MLAEHTDPLMTDWQREREGPLPLVLHAPYSTGLSHLPSNGLVSAVSKRLPEFHGEFSRPRPASHCEQPFFLFFSSRVAINHLPSHFFLDQRNSSTLIGNFLIMGDKKHCFLVAV